jgi:uncharacterized lipoprotein YddW (UPF0748 family)
MIQRILYSLLFVGFFISVNAQPSKSDKNVFEFRGVWIATVENIDYPSKRGLSNEAQKEEFLALLDRHQQNGMNAIIMQIRPAGDALYPSALEPWSEYLMGKQGQSPIPFYDPLVFMIEETHKRGMEFHAWINPYRAVFNINKSSVAPSHLSKMHPEWFINFEGKKYFNPGLPEVWNHTNKVVADILKRYDVDAIHMDDYFYPYRVPNKDFPDQATYLKYARGLDKETWRRSNCDTIIKQLNATIRSIKPGVQFGISPFGVWRNKSKDPRGSATRAGQTNYDDLYADILLWLEKGWIDYVTPQLYWEHGHALADYDELVKWWNDHVYGKALYIGHGIYRAGTNSTWRDPNEIPYQIKKLRALPNTGGSVYFSSNSFKNNPNGWNDSLQQNYYKNPAILPSLVPQYKMIAPSIEKKTATSFQITMPKNAPIKSFAIIQKEDGVYSVASILAADSKIVNLTALGINRKMGNQYWLIAIGLQNQISEYIAIP